MLYHWPGYDEARIDVQWVHLGIFFFKYHKKTLFFCNKIYKIY